MLVDTSLARRIDQTGAIFNRLWLEGAASRDGNPHGLDFFYRGPVVAAASDEQPDNPMMNRAIDLTPDDIEYVRPLVSWYRRKGIWPWFEVGPSEGADTLLDALAAEGAWPVGFVHVSIGAPLPLGDGAAEGLSVEPVDGDSVGVFAEALMLGHAVEADRLKQAAADLDNWHQLPGLFPLLARADGEPAGAAVLFVREGVGLLADASTLLAQRGRGVGAALLAARIQLAAELGCEFVAGFSRFGSTTHLGYQRSGLVSGYTRAVLHLGG
jgi:GNAT superfamily N-acetyltransferase